MTSRDGVTTLWGRNQSDQVYYLSCPTSQLSEPTAWSAPFPILSGIERISAYVNCVDGGNTIFAAGEGKVQKVIQGSAITGKVWRAQEITLAAAPEQPCTNFLSYTTTIHVTQLTSNAPIPKAIVELSANSRAPVYINGVYYVLSTETPLRVLTDQTGTLTVIEATDSLQGTVLTVSLENTTITINPMDHSMDRIAALDSAEKLRSARVPTHTVAGGIDDSTPYISLLDPSTHEDDVEAMAQSFGLLKEAYLKIQGPEKTLCQDHGGAELVTASLLHATTTKTLNLSFLGDLWSGAEVIIGDIAQIIGSIGGATLIWGGDALQWLKNTAMGGLTLIKDTLSGGLHLLGNWAGKAWHVALDTLNTLVGLGEWLWDQGKKLARKATDWVTVLLHWGDIRRTKQVTHNLIRLWMQHQVDQIPHVAAGWNQAITGLEQTINQWAGTTDFAPLGADGDEVLRNPAVQGAANPNEGQTSASSLFISHYRNHAHQLRVVGDSPALNGVESLLFDLLDAVSTEGRVLGELFAQLKLLVQDFASLSLQDVLKRMMGILADFVLSSVQGVVDTLLQVLHTLTQSTLAVLDTKIHIPIISDLLSSIGIPDISFLDLFTWIIAVAFTIVYKITHNTHAPFPDNSSVSALIAANTWEGISRLFGKSTGSFASFALAPHYSSKLATEGESSSEWSRMLFAPGHFLAGLAGFVLGSVTVFEAESETEENPFSTPAMILGIISAGMQGITNHFAPRDEIENTVVEGCEYALITIEVAVKVFFSGTAQGGLTKLSDKSASVGKLVVSNARGLEAIVDAVLILPGIAIMGWHIYELSKKPAGKVKSAAILEECGKVSAWIARVAYAVAVNDPEPDSKEIAAGITGLAIWAAAGFQIGEAEWC
ncbi:hypothetical protein N7462_001692 [Penicillium macrosclerotiorum]|uniref:uncharacterized protein n=1 Tax=Penicillium macrosclerotiorum TaxID=303699 RepID=UPI002546E4AF|nr:uncharacterized protein N7462_001692 [Penicillium macrosclerotiorum]KAJ5692269.1 hypothetical protein N7462_001692 [Penicillium macrosclerotiorum]